MRGTFLLLAALGLAGGAATAGAQSGLPLVLVEKPLHIGDGSQKDMVRAQPDAAVLEQKFTLTNPGRIGEVYLVVKVSHLVPRDFTGFDKGFWQTEVLVNDQSLGVLNKLLRGKEETAKVETLVMPFKMALLKEGENTLRIKPGAKDGDLDDFELHGVSLEVTRPR
jgi:hypothetical protein